jgi:hypothetical protein
MSSRRDVTLMPKMLSNLWLRTFPTAEVTRLEDAGHFLQKNANERIVPELLRFLSQGESQTAPRGRDRPQGRPETRDGARLERLHENSRPSEPGR